MEPDTSGATSIPDMASLPAPVQDVFEHAFGVATGHIFSMAVPVAVVACSPCCSSSEVPLRTTLQNEDELEMLAAEAGQEHAGRPESGGRAPAGRVSGSR